MLTMHICMHGEPYDCWTHPNFLAASNSWKDRGRTSAWHLRLQTTRNDDPLRYPVVRPLSEARHARTDGRELVRCCHTATGGRGDFSRQGVPPRTDSCSVEHTDTRDSFSITKRFPENIRRRLLSRTIFKRNASSASNKFLPTVQGPSLTTPPVPGCRGSSAA